MSETPKPPPSGPFPPPVELNSFPMAMPGRMPQGPLPPAPPQGHLAPPPQPIQLTAAPPAQQVPAPQPRVDLGPVLERLDRLDKSISASQPAPARTPMWLVLAILLLLLCQTVQFGLLIALFLWGPRSFAASPSEIDIPEPPAAEALLLPPSQPVQEPELEPVTEPLPVPPELDALAQADEQALSEPSQAPEPFESEPAAPEPARKKDTPPASTSRTDTPPATASRTASSRTDRAAESSRTTPADPAPSASTTSGSGKASITIERGQGYLVGSNGAKHAPGPVSPGSYQVHGTADSAKEPVLLGRVTVTAGQQVIFRCGFGQCKQIQ